MNVFARIFMFLRVYFDYYIDWLYGLYFKEKLILPTLTDLTLLESATSLARKIREGKLKSEDLVKSCIERIEAVNPIINAVVNTRFDEALAEARKIDQDLKNGVYNHEDFAKKPFLGVPFTTKESTACKGLKWTFGLPCRKHILAYEDAQVVTSMKNAGGILLGNTNIPQLNLWLESYNPLYGLTCNPYDATRNVGGSSGGEAAILAACGSPIGMGTDIGGSIRIPAYMCGIFGHKPSSDLISTKGLTYRTGDEGPTMVVAGPMAKRSEDLKPMLKVLVGDNMNKLNLDKKVDKIKIYYITELKHVLVCKMRPVITNIFMAAIENLKDVFPDEPKEVEFEKLPAVAQLWSYWVTQEPGFNFGRDLTDRKGSLSLARAIFMWMYLSGEYTFQVIFNLFNFNVLQSRKDKKLAEEATEELKKEIVDLLGEDGVLLFPSSPMAPSIHYTAYYRPWNAFYTAVWNVLKLPVTQVPVGLSEDGLPLGVQVIAGPYQDHLCLEVAGILEKKMGGYVSPSLVEPLKTK